MQEHKLFQDHPPCFCTFSRMQEAVTQVRLCGRPSATCCDYLWPQYTCGWPRSEWRCPSGRM